MDAKTLRKMGTAFAEWRSKAERQTIFVKMYCAGFSENVRTLPIIEL